MSKFEKFGMEIYFTATLDYFQCNQNFVIEEVVNLSKQINLEVDSDDVQELLDTHNQELTMDEQDIEELESLEPVLSED
ncbi:hypothetical protein TNCV_3241361 [Trichonephila clavipes]|nr:hypothetical protein TNCV_3241361 [Trichonephila clavipes]